MTEKDLRYIVFMLNPDVQQYFGNKRIDTHDGEIFSSHKEAKEYAIDAIGQKLCTRFVIGMFVLDAQSNSMTISCVETFGFRNDKKNVTQLSIFHATTAST
ncbi:MAG: hypothetical protein EOM47_14700 [Bacteroidia bacterium]|nr:hypothetical protein [Bacteroidia bacterium]